MARNARKQLADMRAMEEEDMRMTMHGSGKHFYGAGATPSMGLSQFRGGRKVKYEEDYETEDEDEMEGGQIGSLIARLAPRLSARVAPTSTAIVPRITARPTSTALVPLGSAGRPIARPSLSATQYRRMLQPRPSASPFVSTSARQVATRLGRRFGPTAARVAALGSTLGAVGSYLDDQFYADNGDAGYFDDYAGEEYDDFYPPETTGDFAPDGRPLIPAEGAIPEGLTPDELAWYLQSGNLPARYAAAASKRKRRGKGKLEITHHEGGRVQSSKKASKNELLDRLMGTKPPRRGNLGTALQERAEEEMKKRSGVMRKAVAEKALKKVAEKQGGAKKPNARAEIVRRVMKERGCSLPEASRIVKAEGMYSK